MYEKGGIPELLEVQANRFPMLFIDRFEKLGPYTAKSWKAFSFNEWFFPTHFPGNPNVPGFVLFEMLAQGLLVCSLNSEEIKGEETLFLGADNVKFRRMVRPGETVMIESTLVSIRRGIILGKSVASVSDEFVCSAELSLGLSSVMQMYSDRLSRNSDQNSSRASRNCQH